MKKFYSIAFALFLGATSMFAQKNTDVRFVTIDEDINKTGEVEDGAVISVSTITDNGFQDPFISTGLGVENTTDNSKRVQVDYEILKLDNGGVQCCFSTCSLNKVLGTFYTPELSKSGNRINLPVVKSHEVQDLAGEWFFGGDGTATVKFTIKVGTKNTSKTDAEGVVYDVVEGTALPSTSSRVLPASTLLLLPLLCRPLTSTSLAARWHRLPRVCTCRSRYSPTVRSRLLRSCSSK